MEYNKNLLTAIKGSLTVSNVPSKALPGKLEVKPDSELLAWEKWVTIRKEEIKRLGRKTGRPPIDLTMNLLENVRNDKEEKVVLEEAQIENKASLRFTLWEQPQRLKQKCYCEPVYEVHRTPQEMGQPRTIQHVGVPTYIQKNEKGLSGIPSRKPCSKLNAEYEKYKDKRERDLNTKIIKIDPFRSNLNDLIVIGKRPKIPPKKLPSLPSLTVTELGGYTCVTLSDVCAVRINNSVFYRDIPDKNLSHLNNMQKESWHENCNSWIYYFNVPVKCAGRCKVFLENLGTVTLRYSWKKINKPIPFIPEDQYEQNFFFNKNEDVLAPGQSREICITYVADKASMHCEFWELSFCNTCFFETISDKITFEFCGDSVEDVDLVKKRVSKLRRKINTKTVYNLMVHLIDDVINKSSVTEPHIYSYKKMFLEAELFEMKNPVCYYHQTEIQKMRDTYSEMVPSGVWDLSIGTWRTAMMGKEYDDRMKYYELLKSSHLDLLKPWNERTDLIKQKQDAIKRLIGQLADKFDEEYERITSYYLNENIMKYNDTPTSDNSNLGLKWHNFESDSIRNLFFVHVLEHVAVFTEACAGVLSSIDLNRWIQFDFCNY